ncbi:hypothetical protein [Agrococcus sp. ARC_14]|uniref:HAAS signaling domain-containing protein n=1 Tax=Agrococcus sp. ARC_14 TaxID=2919927 RepID=UPI001F061237|nr:hypothetical protein [Agrococcus sp. ARC_14]MCH1882924.1 hypothetical protein [Agrococcus sp. ARC_14]
MTESAELPPAAQHYLQQLTHESAVLPEGSRQQLLGQIREHMSEAIDDDSDVEAALRRLGHPRELVQAARGDETPPAAPLSRQSLLLWLAVVALAAGLFMLLLSGTVFVLTGRGRSTLIAIPGILLAVAGVLLLIRELRAMRSRPTAALETQRILTWLGIAALAAGLIVLAIGGGMFALTTRWRSVVVIALPGILLAIAGTVLLLSARRRRSASDAGS